MSHLPIQKITVHSAATRPSMDVGVDWIRNIHVNQNDWSDVGYHFVIKRDGTVQKGRPFHIPGAHTGGNNTGNTGICLIGGVREDNHLVPEDNYTPEQYTSLSKLLDELLVEYPGVDLYGHNDFPGYESRGCPCFDQHAYFKWFREAREAEYRPDDWYDNRVYDWHSYSLDGWSLPDNFYQAIDFEESPSQK